MTNGSDSTWFLDPDALLEELRGGVADQPGAGPEFAGYEDVVELSRGGQGVVYTAVQRSTRRRVAIKVLRDRGNDQITSRRRFEREIDLVASLRHTGIVRVYDSGRTVDDRSFLVMEFIDGHPLDEHVRPRDGAGARSLREIVELIAQIADAVHYAHQRGVIHRDLKPSNIRVDGEGQPHVLDFGLAKTIGDDATMVPTVTAGSGQFLGSLPWASPEQVQPTADGVDVRSDVYALGVVLYQMLTGRFPYDVESGIRSAVDNIVTAEPTPPQTLNRDIDSDLAVIVGTCLAKEPDRRYQTAGEIADDLRRYLRDEPIRARGDSAWYTLRKRLRRYRLAAVAAGLLAVTVTAGAGATWWKSREAATQRDLAEQRFEDVQSLAETMIFDLHDAIEDLPGSRPARQLLVERALEYLDRLELDTGDDPDLLLTLGKGYQRVALLQGSQAAPSLGDVASAIESLESSAALLARRRTVRDDALVRRAAAQTQLYLGEMHSNASDLDAAAAAYADGLAAYDALISEDPTDLDSRRGAAMVYAQLSDIELNRGNDAGAIAHQAESQRRLEGLAEEAPSRLAQEDLVYALLNTGFLESRAEDDDAAMATYASALAITQEILAAEPDNAFHQRRESIIRNQIAAVLTARGDAPGAADQLATSLGIARRLLAVDPENPTAQSDVAYTLGKLGRVLELEVRHDEMLAAYVEAHDLYTRLAERDASDGVAQANVLAALTWIGDAYMTMGQDETRDVTDRIEHWRESRAWYGKCVEQIDTMRAAGTLTGWSESIVEALPDAIDTCDTEIAELRASGSADG